MRSVAVQYRSALAAGVAGSVVIAALSAAVVADLSAPRGGFGATAVDVGVGLVVVVVAAAAGGFGRHQLLMGAVGVAWFAGSALPLARPWHQGVLMVAVALFPTGRLRSPRDLAAVATALVLASGVPAQWAVALAFLVIALLAGSDGRNERSSRVWPTLTAFGVAAVLGTAWTARRVLSVALEPAVVLAVYESLLVLVALTYVVAARSAGRAQHRMTDSIVGAAQLTGLAGLTSELRRAVGDAQLRIHSWSASQQAFLDEAGRPVPLDGASGRVVTVDDGDRPLAVVVHDGTALDDPATAEAVRSAVRLTITYQRLQDQQQTRLDQLHEARTRLVSATDLERDQLREELRTVVLPPIEAARRHVGAVTGQATHHRNAAVADALDVAMGQLSTAGAQIAELTAGVPAAGLGHGRLLASLTALAEASPVPVTLSLDPEAQGDQEAETALYYVCSEALANTAKHADATTVVVTLRRAHPGIELVVADDGRGGADADRTGLAGLADRVAARGGRLRVESPPGAGTMISATLRG